MEEQCRHLMNPDYLAMTEHRYGRIVGKYVIYRGEQTELDDIEYLNVEEYLRYL